MNAATRGSIAVRTAVLMALCGTGANALAADANDLALEEVIVTATKVAQDLNRTPAAITAIGADQIRPGAVQEVRDLALVVPNLSVGDQFGVNRTFIRGIGMTSIDLGADGAVAFLQDGAMIPRPSQQLTGFYDLEQVEVLRGPQGTIYGRGATAGVVNMVTRKPGEQLEGYLNATIGNYNAYTLEGAVGAPIVDGKFAGRVAFNVQKRDGYGKNLYTGDDIDDLDSQAVRGSLRWTPTDDVTIDLIADYFREDDYNYAFHYFGTTVVPEDGLAHNLLGGETIFDYYAPKNPDQRNIVSDQNPTNDREGKSVSGIVDWKVGGWDVRSITAWRDWDRFMQDDLDASDVNMFGVNNYTEQSEAWSEDLTLAGQALNVTWLLGANYFHEDMHGEVKVPLTNFAVLANFLNSGTPGWVNLPNGAFDSLNYWQNGDVEVDAWGAFVQGQYDFTDKLSMTAGVRYNYEKRTGTGYFEFDLLVPPVTSTDKSKSWSDWTPKLLFEYKLNDTGIAYAQYTQGFKSGVINIGSTNDVIDPETVDAYEIGYKSTFADGRVSLRTAAFFYQYDDLQVGYVNEDSVVQTVNAASAENKGIELEMTARLTEGLTGNFSATWLDATYTDFVTGDYRQGFAQVDLSGNTLANAPEYTARAALDYRRPVAANGSFIGHIDYSWQDKVYFTEFNNSDAEQDAYGILNLSAGYEGSDGRWGVNAWVRNATDELVYSNNIITAPLYGSIRVGSLLPPRTYGLTLSLNF